MEPFTIENDQKLYNPPIFIGYEYDIDSELQLSVYIKRESIEMFQMKSPENITLFDTTIFFKYTGTLDVDNEIIVKVLRKHV